MSVVAKLHERKTRTDARRVLAVCDSSLLGKKLVGKNGACLDLTGVFKNFFQGNAVTASELAELFDKADSANVVGEKAVALAAKAGWADGKRALSIAGVPHLQVYKV